jgi:hypothetical protein
MFYKKKKRNIDDIKNNGDLSNYDLGWISPRSRSERNIIY